MRISKKFLLSVLCFVLTLILCSAVLFYPIANHELRFYRDNHLRASLAGQIDSLFLGASHGLCAFDPQEFDTELGTFSYNLSSTLMDMESKIYMLEKELQRNPVKTVYLEVSYDTLYRAEDSEYGEGPAITVQRLDSIGEVIDFMVSHVSVND